LRSVNGTGDNRYRHRHQPVPVPLTDRKKGCSYLSLNLGLKKFGFTILIEFFLNTVSQAKSFWGVIMAFENISLKIPYFKSMDINFLSFNFKIQFAFPCEYE
jgi:hypothetical protein